MELNPQSIRDNLDKIGVKEALALLKEWIISSNDFMLREEALNLFGSIDEGTNFNFYEQLFLSDENIEIRLITGNLLKDKYLKHKGIISLLEYTLLNVDNLEQKFLAVEILDKIRTKDSRKIIKNFLGTYIQKKLKKKIREFPQEIFATDYDYLISPQILEICFNLILYDYYIHECGYSVSLKNGFIILLNCEGANLKQIKNIPSLNRLTHLEHLLLARNNIEKIEGLEVLPNLRILDLSSNQIKVIENLEHLTSLEELNLLDNKIERIQNLESLINLIKLNFEHNLITEIQGLENLKNLEELNLNKNQITEIKKINNLTNLIRLSLSFNQIKLISGLTKLENLIWLTLNDNKISQIQGLEGLKNLKVLNLTNNLIERVQNLDNQQNLIKLELSNNKIHYIESFEHLKKLQELFLDRNYIKTLDGIECLESLIILFIERNNISEFDSKSVDNLKNLNFLFLNENPLTPQSWLCYKRWSRF
ncbi:MAG: hypothetical protein EU532_10105 [Promethearchaeota archaeon]|nr:MAG: hypothetical protein EU532_10105 [Candidatus Lokiarchaeota archaeon]